MIYGFYMIMASVMKGLLNGKKSGENCGICKHLLKESLKKNFIFCAVYGLEHFMHLYFWVVLMNYYMISQ